MHCEKPCSGRQCCRPLDHDDRIISLVWIAPETGEPSSPVKNPAHQIRAGIYNDIKTELFFSISANRLVSAWRRRRSVVTIGFGAAMQEVC